MKSFTTVAFAALSAAATLVARDAAQVSSDVDGLTSQLATLDAAINAFTDPTDTQGALDIENTVGPLVDAINSATSDTQSSDDFTQAESGDIGTKVLALQDPIKGALDDLVAKRMVLNQAVSGADGIITQNLNDLQTATDAFGAALTDKLTASFAALAPGVISSIDALFASAKSVFASGGESTPPSGGSSSSMMAPSSSMMAPSSSAAPSSSMMAPSSSAAPSSSMMAPPSYGSSSSAAPTGTSAPVPTYGNGNGTSPAPTSTPEPYHGAASMVTFSVGSALLAVVAFAL